MNKDQAVQNRLFAEVLRAEASSWVSAGNLLQAMSLQDQANEIDPMTVQSCGCPLSCVHNFSSDCSSCEYYGGHTMNCPYNSLWGHGT